jgi:hypothetical protein
MVKDAMNRIKSFSPRLAACVLCVIFVQVFAPAAWAWGSGHDTVARCILKKLPKEWQSKFKPEWMGKFLAAAHLPDKGDPKLLKPEDLAWLRENCDLGNNMYALHKGLPVYGEIERLVNALRTGDDYSVFVYLASLSHSIADGAACNHDPIVHMLTYTWSPEGSPQGRGLPVLPKTGREWPVDFSFVERDADTKAVLARRLDALTVPEPPADITLERLFALVDCWDVLSIECNNRSSGRIIEDGAKWVKTGDVAAKCASADALCNLGLWSVERTLYLFKAAQILAARPDFLPTSRTTKDAIFAKKGTNEIAILRRPMANDSFARPYFAEPGSPSRVRVMYSPIDHMVGSVFDVVARPVGCQIIGSLKARRPELNASLMDAREFAKMGLDPKVTPIIVIFRRVTDYRRFDAKGFEEKLRVYAKAGGKVIWINGKPPAYLIGAEALQALRDVDRKDGYCKPCYPVPLDELMTSFVAWVGPGEKHAWKYVHKPVNVAGWHWVGAPQWFERSELPKDVIPLIELRAHGRTFLTGIASGSCAYIPLNAIFPFCITDDRPKFDPFVLRLDSAGEEILLAILDFMRP